MREHRDAPEVVAVRPVILLVQDFDGCVFPLLRHLPPVPHFGEDGTEALQNTGLVVVVIDIERFGGEEVGADRLPVSRALRCRCIIRGTFARRQAAHVVGRCVTCLTTSGFRGGGLELRRVPKNIRLCLRMASL